MHSLFLQPDAESDIEERIAYYNSRQDGLGTRFNHLLQARVASILDNPHQFGAMYRNFRAVRVPKFQEMIYYRIRRSLVIVEAVIHGRRHPAVWKRRLR